MRKLTKTCEPPDEFSEVPKSYGAIFQGLYKGFITCSNYHGGFYTVRSVDFVTRGNGWDSFNSFSLQETLRLLIEHTEVFEFDNPQELFKWLSEPVDQS